MGYILPILSIFAPRLVMIGIAVFTDWTSTVWTESYLWPILGWLFMPYTTLAYMAAQLHGGLSGGWIVLLIVAILFDLGGQGSSTSS